VPSLPARGAFGLRGRIVGAVLVTTVATLAVAAVALLGPLEQSLRKAEQSTLKHDLHKSTVAFSRLSLGDLVSSPDARQALARTQGGLASRIGAVVNVLGNPGTDGSDSQPLLSGADSVDADAYDDVAIAFDTGHAKYSFASIDGREYARAALPFRDGGLLYVLAVRKPIDEIPGAVRVVRTAFLDAALAGLGLTLILGIPLSARLVRRLRRLREAALELAHEGPEGEVPVDRARDEVGDLARTLATMQQRLMQQEEARRSFVATASHELRTPLTSLDGMLELLGDDLRYDEPDLEDARALLERARAQSRRLGRLAADLLDLSRIDAKVDLRSEPVELGELSRAVLAEFELGTEERGITSQLDDAGGSVWALGDPGSIARILRILLDNAVRISPLSSEIKVALRRAPDVAISVCDQGPGVRPEEREMIFRRFHRGRDTAGQAGFGLGLAIGRELAERMGGELILEPGNGRGATFTLKLPADRAQDRASVPVA
jgi:signal transduction histidine kinase